MLSILLRKGKTFIQLDNSRKRLFLSAYHQATIQFFKKEKVSYGPFVMPGDTAIDTFPTTNTKHPYIKAVQHAIRLTKKYHPLPLKCRHEARLAAYFLRKKNIPYFIFVGFIKKTSAKLEGHAWTVCEGKMITGRCKHSDFQVTQIFTNINLRKKMQST